MDDIIFEAMAAKLMMVAELLMELLLAIAESIQHF